MATIERSFQKYVSTGYFSKLILDYLSADEKLQKFYSAAPTLENFAEAISAKETKNKQTITR